MPAFNIQLKPLHILALSNILINEIYAKGGGRGGGGRSRGGYRGGSYIGGYSSGGSGGDNKYPVATAIIGIAFIILGYCWLCNREKAEKAEQETAGLTGEADNQPAVLTVPAPTSAPIGNAVYPTSTVPAPIEPVLTTYTPMSMSAMNNGNKTGEPNVIPASGLLVAGGLDGPMPSAPPPAYGM